MSCNHVQCSILVENCYYFPLSFLDTKATQRNYDDDYYYYCYYECVKTKRFFLFSKRFEQLVFFPLCECEAVI